MALAAVAAHEIAGREHADAGDLQIGRDHAAVIGRAAPARCRASTLACS